MVATKWTVKLSNVLDGFEWRLAVLLCIHLAYAAAAAAAGAAGRIKVELEPRHPLIASGENLTLNCTLSHFQRGISADDLFFKVNNPLLNASFLVEVLTKRTAALKVTNVERNMSGVVECHHRSEGVASDATRVVVAEKPKKPRIRDCKVFNWENMSCFWDSQENGIQTNISVSYNLGREFTHIGSPCPNRDYSGENSCSWLKHDSSDRFVNKAYWLYIHAVNKLGFDYDVTQVDPNLYVHPGKISSLKCTAKSSQSCLVSWSSPAPGKNLNYRIKFKSHWDDKELVVNTNKTSVQLTDLIPATDYQLTIDCIPLVHENKTGFWSSADFCDCQTHTDVPALNPPVTSGAYRVLPALGNFDRNTIRRIQLYWQPVPRRWANGEITGIRLRKTRLSDGASSSTLSIPESSWKSELSEAIVTPTSIDEEVLMVTTNATVDLDAQSTYILTVEAQTSAGYNESLVPLSVVILKQSKSPPFPVKFVVSKGFANSYYTYIDISTFPKASGYTIYWCSTAGNRPDICTSPYEWTKVSPLQKEHKLDLPDHPCTGVRFHVSLESVLPSGETVSSGMLAVDSIYSRYGGITLPENLRSQNSANKPDSLTIYWNIDKSYCKRSEYISHYVIRYCSSTCHEKTVEGSTDFAVLDDLLPGTIYRIQMKSCSFKNESNFTEAFVFTTSSVYSERPELVIAISIAASVVALVFVLLLCCRLKLRAERNILIVVPKKCSLPEVQIKNVGYRPQALPNDEDPYLHSYNRSMSVNSGRHIRVNCSPLMTSESSDLSSHVVSEVNASDVSSSSSCDYASIRCNSAACRVLPDLRPCGISRLPEYNSVVWEVC